MIVVVVVVVAVMKTILWSFT